MSFGNNNDLQMYGDPIESWREDNNKQRNPASSRASALGKMRQGFGSSRFSGELRGRDSSEILQ